jgi:hypothetical protein
MLTHLPPWTLYLFCPWIWLLSVLYLNNKISFSPLYLSVGAASFTILFTSLYFGIITSNKYTDPLRKYSILECLQGAGIVVFELVIAILVTRKHFNIDMKSILSKKDAVVSILIFTIYLLFLKLANMSFYQFYVEKIFYSDWYGYKPFNMYHTRQHGQKFQNSHEARLLQST